MNPVNWRTGEPVNEIIKLSLAGSPVHPFSGFTATENEIITLSLAGSPVHRFTSSPVSLPQNL
jgi:hypothetical protein